MPRLTRALAFLLLCPAALLAQQSSNSSSDINDLRQMLQQQSKQIDVLAQEIARLNLLLESKSASNLPPISTDTQPIAATAPPAPVAEPVAVTPRAPTPKSTPSGPVHIITKGETLTAIAKHYKITVGELLKVNKIADVRKLQIGQTLALPPGAKIPESPSPSPQP